MHAHYLREMASDEKVDDLMKWRWAWLGLGLGLGLGLTLTLTLTLTRAHSRELRAPLTLTLTLTRAHSRELRVRSRWRRQRASVPASCLVARPCPHLPKRRPQPPQRAAPGGWCRLTASARAQSKVLTLP